MAGGGGAVLTQINKLNPVNTSGNTDNVKRDREREEGTD